jgi:hypothetical protein
MNALEQIVYLFSDLCGPFDVAQDMLCGRYSEFHLWLCRARTLAMFINRIKYRQRETLH